MTLLTILKTNSMKKLTLFLIACSVSLMGFAAGGNITYELNGGVTNDHGWQNKNDMYMGLNQAWNTFSGTSTVWKSLDELLTGGGDPIASGIPTEAAAMALTFIEDATVKAEWQWLVDYMDATCEAQEQTLPSSNASFLRYNLSAFFLSAHRTGWPISADYAVAGQPEAFIPAWEHAFAGPDSYDGTEEVIIPDPFKADESFAGWYDNAAFDGERITKIAAGTDGDITLYAKWGDYVPTVAEIQTLDADEETLAAGTVTYSNGLVAYIQDATGGIKVEFTADPELTAGDKIQVNAVVATLGAYKTLASAELDSKVSGSLPASPTVSLDAITANTADYIFEYVNFVGIEVQGKSGDELTLKNGANTVKLIADVDFAAGEKINFTAVVSIEDGDVVLLALPAWVAEAPLAAVDPAAYPAKGDGKYTLTNKWIISDVMDNFVANRIGTGDNVRAMVAKDGKLYFANRKDVDNHVLEIAVVDGETAKQLDPIRLKNYVFRHGEEQSPVSLPLNDIKKDNAGNILVGNLITSNAGVFQVWKIDLETGDGELIVDEILQENPDFAEASVRFDAFGVWGDVDDYAIIMAVSAEDMAAYKWEVYEGEAMPAEMIEIDNTEEGTFLTGLPNPGTAPQIFPMDEDYFYIDGWETLPTLIDMDGNVVDGFYNVDEEVENWTSSFSTKTGHNGLIEFSVGDDHFFLMAFTNTVGTPPSSFRLFKWKDANKEFKDIESLWILPAAGMGGQTNAYRTAVPSVEVDEDAGVATIYLYAGNNGYGVYELTVSGGSGLQETANSTVKVSVHNQNIKFNQELTSVAVYTVTGQLVKQAKNVNTVSVTGNGVYILKAVTLTGEEAVHKVIVK